jgi:hypothetical protein
MQTAQRFFASTNDGIAQSTRPWLIIPYLPKEVPLDRWLRKRET